MAIKTKVERNDRPWRETPLVESAALSKAAGCSREDIDSRIYGGPNAEQDLLLNRRSRIFLKLENLQPSGSFKSRGLGNLCAKALQRSPDPSRVHFYSSSGGNAGLGCVYAAKALGRPASVVVPHSTKPAMLARIRAAGAADVVQAGEHWSQADQVLRQEVMPAARARGEDPVYVHPFDGEEIWDGHASLVDEVAAQLPFDDGEGGATPPAAIVCSAGGGGLFVGVCRGVEAQGPTWAEGTTVIVTQTQGAHALAASLEAGELVTLPSITSLATSLGATRCADRAFDVAAKGLRNGRVASVVLTDAEAAMGAWRFADEERMLVELAGGVSLAMCFGNRLEKALGKKLGVTDKVVIVVCGGSNITTEMMEGYRRQFGDVDADGERGNGNGELGPGGGAGGDDLPSSFTAPNGRV